MVICDLIFSRQSGHSPLPSRHCAARAFSFTSFASFASLASSKSFTIRTSKTPLPQPLYNPHLRAPLGSAGNKGLINPLESALTKNSPVSRLESALTKSGGGGKVLSSSSIPAFKHISIYPLSPNIRIRQRSARGVLVGGSVSNRVGEENGFVWGFGRPARAGEEGQGGGAAATGAVANAEMAGAALRQHSSVRSGKVGLQDFRPSGTAGAADMGGISRSAADGNDV